MEGNSGNLQSTDVDGKVKVKGKMINLQDKKKKKGVWGGTACKLI